jgi:hypothetical protein
MFSKPNIQYTREEDSMDISVIERVLWDAVERGFLNADTVDEVVVRIRAAEADLVVTPLICEAWKVSVEVQDEGHEY